MRYKQGSKCLKKVDPKTPLGKNETGENEEGTEKSDILCLYL